MALTQEEISLVRESWEPVKQDMDPVGKLLFQIMFEDFPQYAELFDKFYEEGKNLLDSEKFLKHATANVMVSLDKMVQSLEDCEKLESFLKNLGARHFKRNVHSEHFKAIETIAMKTLKQGLGDKFTDDMETVWAKVLAYSMSLMGEGCEEEGNQV